MTALLFSPLGRSLAGGLVALLALWGAYHHVKGKGYAECKIEWNAANASNILKGNAARADGERGAATGLRDGFDRDE
jgi:hypothetical protein